MDKTYLKRGRTVNIPVGRDKLKARVTEKWLEKNCMASTGPYPNITGMRNLYWGKQALIVKHGAYIYLIAKKDDGRELPV